ncbi:hypothetical protein QQ045_007066 [Rhodiola kirilowii]
MDKSWMGLERGDSRYIQGIMDFVQFSKGRGETIHVCPCRKCLMIRGSIKMKEMFCHLINNGIMNGYYTWTSHAEECNYPPAHVLRQEWLAEQRHGASSSSVGEHRLANPTIDILRDAFPFRNEMNMDTDDDDLGSRMAYERYNNLICEAQTPLYNSCDSTVLETIFKAIQLKIESRMSDKSFNKYLHITKEILPRDNNYPSSYKEVKILLKNMGLGYETIHACEYGCILYYKENKDLLSCPVCGEARYAERGSKSKVPKKTVKYFPLTPRLQCLYMSPYILAQMRWQSQRCVDDLEYIRHPTDGEA